MALIAMMSVPGHSRHFGRRPTTSGFPLETDIVRAGRHVSALLRGSSSRTYMGSPRLFGQTMKAEPQVEPRRESPPRKKSIRRMGLYFSVLPFAS